MINELYQDLSDALNVVDENGNLALVDVTRGKAEALRTTCKEILDQLYLATSEPIDDPKSVHHGRRTIPEDNSHINRYDDSMIRERSAIDDDSLGASNPTDYQREPRTYGVPPQGA